ncbi:MAG: glucan biosynthesis protein G [Opitutus sp.]|nr:glucan biosynthesis protein G [Opitutus sp.]
MKTPLRLFVVAAVLLGASRASAADGARFDFEVLRERAQALAAQPYEKRESRVPEWLRRLTYDEHRDIRFLPEQSWWRKEKLPFELQFFHPGFVQKDTVQIAEIKDGREQLIPFASKLFNYGQNKIAQPIPATMGFSGLRIHYALNSRDYLDELAVFQGASYFRALGVGQRWGLSARGLAIDTAEPGGEEFPVFESFWVERPRIAARNLVVYALMDSPSVAGAYRFTITPGKETVMQVKAALYFREAVTMLGLAPLTSMFWHGENTIEKHGDFRPEVHDSDGLMLRTGTDEWVWRPLQNPAHVRVAAFSDDNPKGFGLVQRDRNFENYQDLEAAYHLRPSAWVEPVGNWGRGTVRLVELPTPDETNDNIVAFWTPEKTPGAGESLEFEYKLHWYLQEVNPPAGVFVATRHGHSKTHEPELERFALDAAGPIFATVKAGEAVEPVVTVGEGAKLMHADVQKNPFNDTWRVAFSLKADGSGRPVELRCFLRKKDDVLTETWSYLWQPERQP